MVNDQAEFEDWAMDQKDEHGLPFFVLKDATGQYVDHRTRDAWAGWRASGARYATRSSQDCKYLKSEFVSQG